VIQRVLKDVFGHRMLVDNVKSILFFIYGYHAFCKQLSKKIYLSLCNQTLITNDLL